MNNYLKMPFHGTFNQSQLSGLKESPWTVFQPVSATIQVRNVPEPEQEKERELGAE